MKLSARNQILATIEIINQDDVMAEMLVELEGGAKLVSVITA